MYGEDMRRGFLTIAQNTINIDYIRMAYALAMSIKLTQPKYNNISVIVNTGEQVKDVWIPFFDKVIFVDIPEEEWKIQNKWQYYKLSPYDETIVLDADMLLFNDITAWWDSFENTDLEFTTITKNYRGENISSDYYRKTFTENGLPNLHTALFYFKKTDQNRNFFKFVEMVFKDWKIYYEKFLKDPPKFLSGDVAYSLAAKLFFYRNWNTFLTFTHMRGRLQDDDIFSEWNKELSSFFTNYHGKIELKVSNFNQIYPFHYIQKDFLTEGVIEFYEEAICLL
jgi:hypothetical protein